MSICRYLVKLLEERGLLEKKIVTLELIIFLQSIYILHTFTGFLPIFILICILNRTPKRVNSI